MKKNILIPLLVIVTTILKSQNAATPNPGFENWTANGNHLNPDNWSTLNDATATINVLTAIRATGADAHSGTYAIELITKSAIVATANGIATTGQLITTPPYGINGGIAYTDRPDSIVGWYKYSPQGTDSGFVSFELYDVNGDTVGFTRPHFVNAVGTYTRFSAPVIYYSSNSVTSSRWILSSSREANPVINSTLFIDDIDLVFNSGVGIKPASFLNEISVSPNPATSQIQITHPFSKPAEIKFSDVTGKEIKRMTITPGTNIVAADFLTQGVYVLSFTESGLCTKFIVKR